MTSKAEPPSGQASPAAPGGADGASLPAPEIELALDEPAWAAALCGEAGLEALAAQGAAMALAAAGVSAEGRSVSFLFAGDREMARLNGAHRGKAAPTNVLSWPAWELRAEARGDADGAAPDLPPPPDEDAFPDELAEADSLGDVAMGWETVRREAEAQGLDLRDHALHLALHGVLHLLGYDHERDADARLMESLESRAMLAAGRRDPYLAADADPDQGAASLEKDDLTGAAGGTAGASTTPVSRPLAEGEPPPTEAEKARSDGR